MNEKGPNGSWATLMASSKVTVTGLTIMSAEPESSTQRAGRTPGASSSKRSNSIPEIKLRSGSWRRWMNSLPSMKRLEKNNLSPSDRHLLRLEKAKPLLEQIKTAIQAARGDALPKSALAKACNYTLTLWQRLIRFLENPVLELSNNLAENAIRPVALWTQELDPHRKQGSRASGCSDHLGRRNLPATQNPGSRLPWLDLAGFGRLSDQSHRRTHTRGLAGPKLTAKVRRDAARRQPCVSRTNTTQEFRTTPVPFWLISFSDTLKGPMRQMFFVVLLPDGTVVEPRVEKRL